MLFACAEAKLFACAEAKLFACAEAKLFACAEAHSMYLEDYDGRYGCTFVSCVVRLIIYTDTLN